MLFKRAPKPWVRPPNTSSCVASFVPMLFDRAPKLACKRLAVLQVLYPCNLIEFQNRPWIRVCRSNVLYPCNLTGLQNHKSCRDPYNMSSGEWSFALTLGGKIHRNNIFWLLSYMPSPSESQNSLEYTAYILE